ncbi:MAG: glycine zipper 2TM domain-containing protein [Gammaproteobacteria bacterium]|nr:glycine zipper 2TM domain-containing protein [Gammaproteobacteria bacterium]NIR28564.1 glycine zipper 2TM domain-containing protein [Gammaproteobacteria bacterium]NIR97034.1 glycine zipper 2TM domain-containing protein [Gammaproteobacteria bacterium]NIT62732.1 glycine zipper 2TM domain-containing protein [Gammaproteobacteria bacterium]NIV19690.1 glycine zipper 2TM domain-containing protein [Gammaproteobacteria bacterium]
MKLLAVTLAAAAAAVAVPAPAHAHGTPPGEGEYLDYARVVAVEPVYETIRVSQPAEECWDERVHRRGPARRSATPVVVGGIVGGVIGSHIGKGRGRDAATLAGVLLGASIGNDVRERGAPGPARVDYERVCRRVDRVSEERRLSGYHVVYRYRGHTGETFLDHDPGPRLRVRVSVLPAD